MINKIENKAIRQYVYENLIEMLANGEFPLGQKINKQKIANDFDVSQTPVNDALNKLVGEEYLVEIPRKGYFIREINTQEYADMFEMRAGLEGISIRLCCESATDEEIQILAHSFDGFSNPMDKEETERYTKADRNFHRNIINFAGNPMIQKAMKQTRFISRTYQKGLMKPISNSLAEHKQIISALILRDGSKAAEATIAHLLNSRDRILSNLVQLERK
ncbi:MAG: GntR family transcriptional regulator [Sphaerochaetaceae bacterium]